MKKYLVALIPFIFCSGLALIYGHMPAKVYPDPTYPYRTPGALSYLSSRWFLIGVVLSGLFLIFILMEDISKYIEKRKWERIIGKEKKP